MKKHIKQVVIFAFLVLFFVFLISRLFAKNDYEISYDVDNYHITEAYHKELDYYSFVLEHDNFSYYTIVNNQSFFDKKIVSDIEEISIDDETCILPRSDKVRFNYLCRSGEEQISYLLVSDKMKENISSVLKEEADVLITHGKMDIYGSLNDTVYLWNYKGFTIVSRDSIEEIPMFSKDVYQSNLIYQVGNIIVVPDYESDYYFEKFYLVDMNSKKVSSVDLPDKIYFDSRVLGFYKDSLYLVDKHESKEWKFDVSKKKLERVGNSTTGKIYKNGFEDISMNKMLYQDVVFEGNKVLDYQVKNGAFYQVWNGMDMRIKNSEVKEVVSSKNGVVYYLVDDTLYSYSEEDGERKMIKYFEWNFNFSNVIFVL